MRLPPQNDPRWLIPGGVFTGAVVGLLLALHLRAEPEVPMLEGVDYVAATGLHVCTGQPAAWLALWGGTALDVAIAEADALGYPQTLSWGPCLRCDGDPCLPGRLVMSLADQDVDPAHVGETRLHVVDGIATHGVILLPSSLAGAQATAAQILTHELVCHGTGRAHVRAPLGCVSGEPTGHVCSPVSARVGGVAEGL